MLISPKTAAILNTIKCDNKCDMPCTVPDDELRFRIKHKV